MKICPEPQTYHAVRFEFKNGYIASVAPQENGAWLMFWHKDQGFENAKTYGEHLPDGMLIAGLAEIAAK